LNAFFMLPQYAVNREVVAFRLGGIRELKKRQNDTLAGITAMEVRDDGAIINAQADMPGCR